MARQAVQLDSGSEHHGGEEGHGIDQDGHVGQVLIAQHSDVFEIVALLDEADGLLDAPAAEIGGHYRTKSPGFERGMNMNEKVEMRSTNVTRVANKVDRALRVERNGHNGGVLWCTGLPSSGKSTLAVEVEQRLFAGGYQVYVLDGDNLRHGLNADLGFSSEDRIENIRRVGELAALFAEAGFVVVCAFISPYRADRRRARKAAGEGFHEIYIKADIETCEGRDVKGLYRKARTGEIPDFTGVSAPYEAPENCELVVDTNSATVAESVALIVGYVDHQFPRNK